MHLLLRSKHEPREKQNWQILRNKKDAVLLDRSRQQMRAHFIVHRPQLKPEDKITKTLPQVHMQEQMKCFNFQALVSWEISLKQNRCFVLVQLEIVQYVSEIERQRSIVSKLHPNSNH